MSTPSVSLQVLYYGLICRFLYVLQCNFGDVNEEVGFHGSLSSN